MIKHEGDKWVLYAKDGSKKLGTFDSEEAAKDREREIQAFKHMKEEAVHPLSAVGRLLEATEPTGSTWRVRVLRFGRSLNGWLWTKESGEALLPHLDGAPVGLYRFPSGMTAHADEDAVHAAGGPVVRNIVGDLTHPAIGADGVYADLHLHEDVPWLKTKLLGIARRGQLAKVLGLSVDTLASYAPVQLADGAARAIKGISRLISVDVVGSPSADGRFVAVKAGPTFPEEDDVMSRETLLTLVKESRPSLLEGKDEAALTEEQLLQFVRESMKIPEPPPPVPTPAPAIPAPVSDPSAAIAANMAKLQEEFAQRVSMMRVDDALKTSNLPRLTQERIRSRFTGRAVEVEDIDREIKAERDYLAKVTESNGDPKGYGQTKAEVTTAPRDKVQAALDAMFGIKEEPFMRAIEANSPFSPDAIQRVRESFTPHRDAAKDPGLKFKGIRDFYTHMTGDVDITGKTPSGRISEAVLSTTWGDVLGNTLYRTLLATYAEQQYGERTIARYGRAADFRTKETVILGYFADLANVAENGAYVPIADPGDDKVTYAVAKRGNLFEVTMETIKNDDMRVVAESVRRLGRAARRTLASYVWTMWNGAGVVYDVDTLTWFHATHGNTGTVALTADLAGATEVYAKIVQLAQMTESPPSGSTAKLGFPPTESLWLDVPLGLASVARRLVVAPEFGAGNTNMIFGMFGTPNRDPEGSIRVNANPLFADTNDWGIHVNPNTGGRESIWIDFLDGNEEPELFLADTPTQGTLFTHDRIQYKIRHIYGGDLVDFRGAAKNIVIGALLAEGQADADQRARQANEDAKKREEERARRYEEQAQSVRVSGPAEPPRP